jgi:hypothetical protein
VKWIWATRNSSGAKSGRSGDATTEAGRAGTANLFLLLTSFVDGD